MNFIDSSLVPLRNAAQLGEFTDDICSPDKCSADKAIDGNILTESVTEASNNPWWSVEFTEHSVIDRVFLHIGTHAHSGKEFRRFKVETRMKEDEKWSICKKEYSVEPPLDPHVVYCERPMEAKYMNLSNKNEKQIIRLHLLEVTVQRKGNQFTQSGKNNFVSWLNNFKILAKSVEQ